MKEFKSKYLIVITLIIFMCISIGILWAQELKYQLPTPVPVTYKVVLTGDAVAHSVLSEKPVFLHFFNPACPCSKFNFEHFRTLHKKYNGEISFAVVLQSQDPGAVQQFKDAYNADVQVYVDADKSLAGACGVYSTPQAVIVKDGQLYFRGNYNKARYCTDPNSNFAQMALDSFRMKKAAPEFSALATTAYGCGLPGKNEKSLF